MDKPRYIIVDSETEASDQDFTEQESVASVDRPGTKVPNDAHQKLYMSEQARMDPNYAVDSETEASDMDAGPYDQQYEQYEQYEPYEQDGSGRDSSGSSDYDDEQSVYLSILKDSQGNVKKKKFKAHSKYPDEAVYHQQAEESKQKNKLFDSGKKKKNQDEKGPGMPETTYASPEENTDEVPQWYLVGRDKRTPSGHRSKSGKGGVSLVVRKKN